MDWWWIITGALAVLLGIQVFFYRKLKRYGQFNDAELARLRLKLTDMRKNLAEVNARRKKLLAASTQALIIVERDGRITSANKVAKRLFGKFKKPITLMAWTRQYQLHELVEQTLAGQKMPPLHVTTSDERVLEAHARSIKEEGEIVAVALAINDITELQNLSRARRQFVTNISHELRTPLASLRLITETLLNGALNDKKMAPQLVEKIALQVDTLSQLAQEVLDLSLIESGRAPLQLASYPLQQVAKTQLERLLLQAERKSLALDINIDDDMSVLVDKQMIGRVITNLVHNAIKFTDKGGVTVSAITPNGQPNLADKHVEDGWVVVGVSDTGVGIPGEELPRIFERFYKVDRARSGSDSGTGLGLAIAKHIVEAHGGQIWAEANHNGGATFYFTVPTEAIAQLEP